MLSNIVRTTLFSNKYGKRFCKNLLHTMKCWSKQPRKLIDFPLRMSTMWSTSITLMLIDPQRLTIVTKAFYIFLILISKFYLKVVKNKGKAVQLLWKVIWIRLTKFQNGCTNLYNCLTGDMHKLRNVVLSINSFTDCVTIPVDPRVWKLSRKSNPSLRIHLVTEGTVEAA